MAKPYWGYTNYFPDSGTTLTARAASTTYPVTNLSKHRLWPGYRSADKALSLNGTNEYAEVANHADFNITGDFSFECIFMLSDLTGGSDLYDKLSATDGIRITIRSTGEVRVQIDNSATTDCIVDSAVSTIAVDTWYILKVVYDASAAEVTAYLNRSSLSMSLTSGTIPTAIGTNTDTLYIGSNNGSSNFVTGKISSIGIAATESDDKSLLNPTACQGYWNFDSSDLTDSSGNSHTLTGTEIDSSNYVDSTAFQWITYLNQTYTTPRYLFLDRRHNLTSSATINVIASGVYSAAQVTQATGTATAATTYTDTWSSGTSNTWSIEIHDPTNTDGYIEIPYLYFGPATTSMQRGFLRGYSHTELVKGLVIPDSSGGFTGYAKSGQLWQADLRFRADSTDFSTLQSVIDTAYQMRPVVFSEDATDAKTRLVYLPQGMNPQYSHVVSTNNFVDLSIQEAGGSA